MGQYNGKKMSFQVDTQILCWHNQCQVRFINNNYKLSQKQCQIAFCKKCGIMPYCSQAHYKKLYKHCHKQDCGSPPFRPPGREEELLCQALIEVDQSLEPILVKLFPKIKKVN